MSRKTVSMNFITDHCVRNSRRESVCVSTSSTVFSNQVSCVKAMFSAFVNIVLTETCFSVNTTYFSVDFTCFTRFKDQILHYRSLFKPSASFSGIFHGLKINISPSL